MKARTAFVTGGTGFLGSFLISSLLRKGYQVIALVRGPDPVQRLHRVVREASDHLLGEQELRESLVVVQGEVQHDGFGLSLDTQAGLARAVDEIWHCATSFKYQEHDREVARAHNVDGAQHVLDFASRCDKRGGVRLFHLSTVCAAPVRDGVAQEELAPEGSPYRNLYEWSKRKAEQVVMRYRQEQRCPILILRPSIITGHSLTGKATRFNGYYGVLRALALLVRNFEANLGREFDHNLRLRILANPHLGLNLVPVDFVVEAMWQLSRLDVVEKTNEGIFHLANEKAIPLADLFCVAADMLQVTGIDLVEAQSFQRKPMSGLERLFHHRAQFQAPYLLDCPHFATTNFRKVIPVNTLPCPIVGTHTLRQINHYYLDELDRQFQAATPPRHTIGRQSRHLAFQHRPSEERLRGKDTSNTDAGFKQAA